jgi:cell volume regulation protein A
MTTVLIVLSIIVLTSVLLSAVSDKSGIPMLLIFIVFGMLIGSSDLIAPFDNFEIANKVCSTALIFIMFFGGFGTSWNAARPVAGKAIILASLGVFFTAAITGLFSARPMPLPSSLFSDGANCRSRTTRTPCWRWNPVPTTLSHIS